MKARIRTETFTFEYAGPPRLWNEVFRSIVGGAKSPEEETAPEAPAQQPAGQAAGGQRLPHLGPGPRATMARSPFAGGAPMPAGPEAYGDVDLPRGSRGPDRREDFGGRRPDSRPPQRDARSAPRQEWDARQQERTPRKPRLAPQAPPIERTGDPAELYARLGEIPGRRSEKDGVLAAVWFVSKGERDVTPEEVEQHLRDHGGPPTVKVRPLLQKHVNRSKMLDAGANPGTFKMNRKGAHYVIDHLVGT